MVGFLKKFAYWTTLMSYNEMNCYGLFLSKSWSHHV